MARRKPRLLKCEVLNGKFNDEEQKEYDKRVSKALATALYRSLEPDELNEVIRQLKEA